MLGNDLLHRVRSLVRYGDAHRDDRGNRGVSFTVSYVLTVAIAVVLVAGVLFAAGQVVKDHRAETIQGEATVVGDQTAAAVMAADRLGRQGNRSNASMALRLPERLAGEPYTVALRANASDARVVVRTQSPSVAVSVPLANRTRIENATVTGPDVRVVFNTTATDEQLTLERGES